MADKKGLLPLLQDLKGWTSEEVRHQFGGKSSGLFEALAVGLPVPSAWLIGIEDYEAFLQAHPHTDPKTFKSAASKWLASHFSSPFSSLPDVLFAVRSSSQFEDAQAQSYAGIFESYLDVPRQKIPEAIAEVWDSCFSFRAATYHSEKKDLRMGVLIQPMVVAKFAGVAFSKHPSPETVYENQNIVIEFAPTTGEKIVQGEVTPFRLSGSFDQILSSIDISWIPSLLEAILKLKQAYRREVDIEFVVDPQEQFWLVQQRPISSLHASHLLNLSCYQRKYKRSLQGFDIELLIEGCSRYLAGYLEIPYQLERWMVMVTGADGVQELWAHSLLDQAIVFKVSQKIEEDTSYLDRLEKRYDYFYREILSYPYSTFSDRKIPLETRFHFFFEFILPLEAHYYVPMFLIDSLSLLLKKEMDKVDPLESENDLLKAGTWNISTLMDLLYDELRKAKKAKASADLHKRLEDLADRYGFLRCRQIDEKGYSAEELFEILEDLPPKTEVPSTEFDSIVKKYFSDEKSKRLFDKFRFWMKIRNREMEFLMYALLKSRPLFEEISDLLQIPIRDIWKGSHEMIHQAIQKKNGALLQHFDTSRLVIFRNYGKTRLSTSTEIVYPGVSAKGLQGKKVFGSGKLEAKVKIAFLPKELEGFTSDQPTVLVTGMTTPDFIPYLRKHFAALITDEGGILCHAAIIAREIPIPCIVGTGSATLALSEGELIAIDFDRGAIAKLS